MRRLKIVSYISMCLLIACLTACSDSATGPDGNGNNGGNGTPPAVPSLQEEVLKVDLSYFKQAAQKMVQGAKKKSNYKKAKMVALRSSSFLNTARAFVPFLALAENKKAEFKDGQWIWNYSYEYGKNSYSMRLTSSVNENDDSASWALYFSMDLPDQQIKNYKFMEGTVAADGLSGQWQINSLDPDSEFRIVFEWEVTDDNEKELRYTIYDDSGDKKISVDYSQTGAKYLLEYAVEFSGITEIGWNTDTGVGHYEDSDRVTYCWSSALENSPCD